MSRNISVLALAAIFLSVIFNKAQAQDIHSLNIGSFHSPKGFGICLEKEYDFSTFDAITLIADMHGVLTGEHPRPGVKMTFTRNIIFKHYDKDGYIIDLYAGPGVTAGYARDIQKPYCLIAGLSGVLGGRFSFPTRLSVNIEVGSDIAIDITRNERMGNIGISLYKSGIYHIVFPQLRIQYSF